MIPTKAYLVINAQVSQLTNDTTTIGRKLDNHMVIQDTTVSRYHAEIQYADGTFMIKDLDSTSGTYVNNKKVVHEKIYSGDIILFGKVPLMFIIDDSDLGKKADMDTDSLRKMDKKSDKKE